MFKKYIAYLQDNPEGYWFKRKIYGWGWVPARREGWIVTLLYIAGLVLSALTLDEYSSDREVAFTFLLPVLILTVAFMRVCYVRGESPRWQWGMPKDKNKNLHE